MSLPIHPSSELCLDIEADKIILLKQDTPLKEWTTNKEHITSKNFQKELYKEIKKHENFQTEEEIKKVPPFAQDMFPIPGAENNIAAILQQYKKDLPEQTTQKGTANKAMIRIPSQNVRAIDFSKNISENNELIKQTIFYNPQFKDVVEINMHHDSLKKCNITQFNATTPKRLLNILEEAGFFFFTYNYKGEMTSKSPTRENIDLLQSSTIFRESLNQANRFFTYPFMYINTEGKFRYTKKGYYHDLQSYCNSDIELELMNVEQAKQQIDKVFSGFCFQEPEDKTMAVAYLLTGACRGLYDRITCRTPLFIIAANRERAGKDYLAGVISIIYEGDAQEDPPIVSDKENSMGSEELRKYITTKMKSGERRFHSSNNRGFLGNAVFEKVLTNEVWTDRLLGKNEQGQFNNEMEFSLSANTGLRYTADLFHRSRRIGLFFSEEDPNAREFPIKDLWGYVKANRPIILSAIYTLINDWIVAGQPSDCIFSSFPEWARVVGGVMKHHNLGDPCVSQQDDVIGGDSRTQDMKKVFEHFHAFDGLHRGLKTSEIINKIIDEEDLDIFPSWDLNDRSGRTKFALLLTQFRGRVLSGIKLTIDDPNQRNSRILYFFKKESGNVGNHGNDSHTPIRYNKKIKSEARGEQVTNVTNVTNLENPLKTAKNIIENHDDNADLLFERLGEKIVKKLESDGVIFRRSRDCYSLVVPDEVIR